MYKNEFKNSLVLRKIGLEKVITLLVRFVGIGSRFLLTFLLTKEISLEFQGEYSLVVTSVALLVILFGFDFYVHSNRMIVKGEYDAVFCLKNSVTFYLLSYCVLFPAIWFFFKIFSIEFVRVELLLVLILFEHLGQEFFRTYIALGRPLLANILLFIRTGLWCLILVLGLLFLKPFQVDLNNILVIWLISAIICAMLGFIFFPNLKSFFKIKVDKIWIKRGVIVGATMFLSTICLKIIEYSDRYLIVLFTSKKDLGIYSVFFQLVNVVNVVVFTMYISFLYPSIIKGVYNSNFGAVRAAQKTIKTKTILAVVFYGIASFFFLPFFLEFIGKEELNQNMFLFYIMLISTLFLNFSFTSHYVIVGAEKEKMIFTATFIACLVNLAINFSLIPFFGIYGSAFAMLLSNITLFVIKRKFEKKIIKISLPNASKK
ncbi:oligosaccharide flippase family protein [Aquimarina rubra]|uniref:Polysaccharide biosynthesis C-terminal domain-containing protein n=1 Tax=Aquimarina rubra TaxID=1920033 RepID=A0ABW5LHA5_9FLAO